MILRRDLVLRALEHIGAKATSDEREDERRLLGFLTVFRSVPAALRKLLEGVPDADEICVRYAVLRDAAGDGVNPEDESVDAYFVVRQPQPIAIDRAEQLLRDHYEAMASLAHEIADVALSDALRAAAAIEWTAAISDDDATNALDIDISEVVGDHLERGPAEHPILGLREAAYGLAASYEIARYLLWPAYRQQFATSDPYAPYVELWCHGVELRHLEDRILACARGVRPTD